MASQQGPAARPVFRFLSMARPAAPPPAAPAPPPPVQAQPQPQPQPQRPAFTFRPTTAQPPPPRPPPAAAAPPPTVSAPPPPQPSPTRGVPPPPAATTSSVPTSPVTRASAQPPSPAQPRASPSLAPAASTTDAAARTATPKSSPKIVEKTPIQSPKEKPISDHPSPLILPPPKMKSEDPEQEIRIPAETEKKTVLVQEKVEKANVIHKSPNKIGQNGKSAAKKSSSSSSNSDEFGMSMITIAGENRGAVMELSPSRKLHKFWGNPQTLQEKEKGNSESDDEKSETKHLTKYMNSNVQGVNNSILLNSSSTHHDPGVHFSLSRNIKGGNGHGTHYRKG